MCSAHVGHQPDTGGQEGSVALIGGVGVSSGLTGYGVDNGIDGVGHISGYIVQP